MRGRFGRNLRRRQAQAVDAFEKALKDAERYRQAYEATAGLLSHCTAKLRKAEDEIDNAKRILGHASAVFSRPQRMDTRAKPGDRIMIDSGPSSFNDLRLPVRVGDTMSATFRAQPLRTVLSHVNVDRIRAMTHFHVHFEDGEGHMAYGLSDTAVIGLPPDILIQRIEREVAPTLARAFVAAVEAGRTKRW